MVFYPSMRHWTRHIYTAKTTWLIILAVVSCFVACKHERGAALQSRDELSDVLDSIWNIIYSDQFTESTKHDLDSIISRYEPLSSTERIWHYELLHWYYDGFRLGDHEACSRIADSALALFANPQFKKAKTDNYVMWMLFKGDALVHLKRLSEAFTYYYQVRSEFLKDWDDHELSQFAMRLGQVRQQQYNYRDAVRYYQEAFALHQRYMATNPEGLSYYETVTEPQQLLNGIAWLHELSGQLDSAATYYQEALQFVERESTRFPDQGRAMAVSKAVIYGNLGGLHNELGQYDSAVHYLRESVAINAQPGYDQRDVQTAQIKLATAYLNLGQFADARRLLDDCRKGLDTLYSEAYDIRWRRVNWQLHDKQGHRNQAYTALLAYHALKDSVEAQDKGLFYSDFGEEFKRKEQELEYTNLAFRNKLNFLAFVMSFVGFLFVLAIVYLIYNNWKRSKRHIHRLNQLTERINQRNEKLQLALLSLQDSQQENTKLMAMVAHDLRTPLSNIQMALTYLNNNTNKTTDHQRFMTIINQSNDEALKLIGELLHSFASKAPGADADDIDLDAMLRDCVEFMQLRATQKDQSLVFEGVPTMVKGNREKIWRVVSNLIDNAIKFTPHEGTVIVRLRHEGQEAVIEVQDNGIGIPAEFTQDLFDIDNVPGRRGTDGEPSTGLGLAIAKQIVSAHNGRIYFEHAPDTGAIFYVHLPF